jgi:hypothetical protein
MPPAPSMPLATANIYFAPCTRVWIVKAIRRPNTTGAHWEGSMDSSALHCQEGVLLDGNFYSMLNVAAC